MNSPFTLAASAEMIYTDLPFVERLQRIKAKGLAAEIWGWHTKDLEAIAASRVPILSMTGYITGELIDSDGADELLRTARQSVEAAAQISCRSLNVHGTGLDSYGLPVRPQQVVTGADWLSAARTLERLARLGEETDVVFTLENLNLLVDHPGTPFGLARDTIALVSAVDHPNLRLNLDLYHAQIGEGNLVELCCRAMPWIGEIQVADVPGRCQPGTGEVNYAGIARALKDMGYTGTVAMEAFASGDSDAALDAFIDAFTD